VGAVLVSLAGFPRGARAAWNAGQIVLEVAVAGWWRFRLAGQQVNDPGIACSRGQVRFRNRRARIDFFAIGIAGAGPVAAAFARALAR
jgi:hypothetical protein